MGSLPLALLFAPDRVGLVAAFTGVSDSLGSGRLPAHLLLLSQGLLPGVFLAPAACAVGAKPQSYRGERALLLFQNLHRYFMYLALIFVFVLSYDAVLSFIFEDGFGIGVGSLVLTLNAVFLASFTFGCNSLRHVVGGNVDCFSCVRFGKFRHGNWKVVSWFNRSHMEWAWISLIWVGFTDLYVRLVSMDVITDVRIF